MDRPVDLDLMEVVLVSLGVLFFIVVVFLSALAYYRRQERKQE